MRKILVTGSEGLVGTALAPELRTRGFAVAGLDLKLPADHPGRADVADGERVAQLMDGCCGIVHLAAVSRVVWAERDPERCWRTNVEATRSLLSSAQGSPARPWLLFASSREVYGEPARLPVAEDDALRPVNIYGRSKAEGESLVLAAREHGMTTAVVRFSNVYGSTDDHPDRVVPAFARGAVDGSDLRVDGSASTFDFAHLGDTVAGVLAVIDALERGPALLRRDPIRRRPGARPGAARLAGEHRGRRGRATARARLREAAGWRGAGCKRRRGAVDRRGARCGTADVAARPDVARGPREPTLAGHDRLAVDRVVARDPTGVAAHSPRRGRLRLDMPPEMT
ncbi:MAG: NAD(P)-dependent oxidoreductase [Geminicoccaceae bacterium]|nr:NAD(P)-dependent oxidoreductase [Geminicoccaceae bacterium]